MLVLHVLFAVLDGGIFGEGLVGWLVGRLGLEALIRWVGEGTVGSVMIGGHVGPRKAFDAFRE
jgi:hypothetical protein